MLFRGDKAERVLCLPAHWRPSCLTRSAHQGRLLGSQPWGLPGDTSLSRPPHTPELYLWPSLGRSPSLRSLGLLHCPHNPHGRRGLWRHLPLGAEGSEPPDPRGSLLAQRRVFHLVQAHPNHHHPPSSSRTFRPSQLTHDSSSFSEAQAPHCKRSPYGLPAPPDNFNLETKCVPLHLLTASSHRHRTAGRLEGTGPVRKLRRAGNPNFCFFPATCPPPRRQGLWSARPSWAHVPHL